jgi:amino-acid N-acetyltransferase
VRFSQVSSDEFGVTVIRKATIKDIKEIHKLLQEYGRRGELLPRPLSVLYDHVRDFLVYVDPKIDRVIGCCALQFCWDDLAEIRSLAVHPDHLKKNIGSKLTQEALSEAASFAVKKVFALTYQPTFFERFGFKRIDKSQLPLKIWADCILCVKFPDCDEIAMMKEFD